MSILQNYPTRKGKLKIYSPQREQIEEEAGAQTKSQRVTYLSDLSPGKSSK